LGTTIFSFFAKKKTNHYENESISKAAQEAAGKVIMRR
jgi:hypothetical protein